MEEKKTKEKVVVATTPKQLTVKERIDNVVDAYVPNTLDEHVGIDELKKDLFKLVERILHPEQFCPKCDERMFFSLGRSAYNCPNCGYEVQVNTTLTSAPTVRQTGSVPPQVDKIIAEANANMKETAIPRKGSMGDKIRKLVDQRDSGTSAPPTAEDEARIKSSDKNTSQKINWI